MMGNDRWIKLYTSILTDSKFGMLPDDLWRLNIELRLLADDDGFLPPEDEIAFYLRRDVIALGYKLKELSLTGLIEWAGERWFIPNFRGMHKPFSLSLYPDNWEDLRQEVLKRDGWKCLYCGNAATHVDHILAVTKGGLHTLDNLASACEHCNKSKNNYDFIEWYSKQSYYNPIRLYHIKTIIMKKDVTSNTLFV